MPSKKTDASADLSADAPQDDPIGVPVRKWLQGGGAHADLPGLFLGDGRFEVEQQPDGSWNLVMDESGTTMSVAQLRGQVATDSAVGGPPAREEAPEAQSAAAESAPEATQEEAPAGPEAQAEPVSEPAPEPETPSGAPTSESETAHS